MTAPGGGIGYDLTLSSGEVLHVIYGDCLEGVAPVLGVDKDGDWTYSIDGGETFVKISSTEKPGSENGYTPQISVDAYGFWLISIDGGNSWERILNEDGLPVSAVDGKSMVPSSYHFFKSVVYNEDNAVLHIELITGEIFDIPVRKGSSISLEYYYDGTYAYAGQEMSFRAEMEGVDEAVWIEVPDGWSASLAEDALIVRAPENGEAGQYSLKLLVHTRDGDFTPYTFKFNYNPKLVFRDDFVGDEIDFRYWDRYVGGTVRSSWDLYQEGDPAQSFVKDGLLTLLGVKYGDTYRTGAIHTRQKADFMPPFRIDCSARFTEMVNGVWFAIWATPKRGYFWGELDIVEKANFGTMTMHTVHNPYTVRTEKERQDQANSARAYNVMKAGEFNTYSVEVREDAVVMYLNGEEVFRYLNIEHSLDDPAYQKLLEQEKPYYLDNFPFMDDPYNILIDIAIGGEFPGVKVDDESLMEKPGQFDIDWISVSRI